MNMIVTVSSRNRTYSYHFHEFNFQYAQMKLSQTSLLNSIMLDYNYTIYDIGLLLVNVYCNVAMYIYAE